MAAAVDDAVCVICFMTAKYKASFNCKLEAEYAMNKQVSFLISYRMWDVAELTRLYLQVPVIPVMMQTNWRPDGWLGIILGSKM
jgi:hypothetical protein